MNTSTEWAQQCAQWWKLHNAQAGEDLADSPLMGYDQIQDLGIDQLITEIMHTIPLPEYPVNGENASMQRPEAENLALALQQCVPWARLLVRLPLSIALPLCSVAPPSNFEIKRHLSDDENQALSWLINNGLMLQTYFRRPPAVNLSMIV